MKFQANTSDLIVRGFGNVNEFKMVHESDGYTQSNMNISTKVDQFIRGAKFFLALSGTDCVQLSSKIHHYLRLPFNPRTSGEDGTSNPNGISNEMRAEDLGLWGMYPNWNHVENNMTKTHGQRLQPETLALTHMSFRRGSHLSTLPCEERSPRHLAQCDVQSEARRKPSSIRHFYDKTDL